MRRLLNVWCLASIKMIRRRPVVKQSFLLGRGNERFRPMPTRWCHAS